MMNETGPEFDPGALKGESLPRKDIPLSEALEIGYRDGVTFERERCAKIVEGEVYETRYRKWPQVSAEGNRSEDSEIVKHCRALAAVIRNQ